MLYNRYVKEIKDEKKVVLQEDGQQEQRIGRVRVKELRTYVDVEYPKASTPYV